MKTLKSVLTQGLKMVSSIRLLAFVAMLALSSVAQTAEFKTTTYYHVDELGTPIAATNESGETLWRNFSSPYGVRYTKPNTEGAVDGEGANYESTGESTAALNRIGFTGHVEDKIDGRQLIYMQARFYDPVIGRFLSPDPVGFNEGNLMSFNRYDYANSNPLVFIDPNGESPFDIVTEVLPAAGRSFGGLAAWGVGHITGDQHLINAALDGMAAQTSDNLFALASIVAPPGANAARKANKLRDKVCSFDGSTEVLTDDGYIAISDLNDVDTMVLSKDEVTGRQQFKPVLDHYWNEYDTTVYVTFENVTKGDRQTIISNKIHPFFAKREKLAKAGAVKVTLSTSESYEYGGAIDNGNWIQAAELLVDDLLLSADETWAKVVEVRITSEKLKAFNLNVADFDSFYVRAAKLDESEGVWVHNCNTKSSPSPALKDDPYNADQVASRQKEWKKLYGGFDPQAVAKKAGYGKRMSPNKAPFDSHGQPVFKGKKGFISPDVDSHNVTDGWKVFDKKGKRTGTWNSDLTVRIKD